MYNEVIPGELYIVCKGDKTVQKFDLTKGKMIDNLRLEVEPHEIEFNAATSRLIVTNHGSNDNVCTSWSTLTTQQYFAVTKVCLDKQAFARSQVHQT